MRLILFLVLLSSCAYKFPTPYRGSLPTSKYPGAISTGTTLAFNDLDSRSFLIYRFDGFLDSKVIGYKLKDDTVNSSFFQNQMEGQVPFGYKHHEVFYPGCIWVSIDKLLDEAEITNLQWAEFLYYIKRDSTESLYQQMLPDDNQLPRGDYFSNSFFRFYPVVGITYEQAETYCKWRTQVVNKINRRRMLLKGIKPPKNFILEFRLPTINEWETYAGCGLDLNKYPQGTQIINSEIRVNPRAAKYLRTKNLLIESVDKIKKDIKLFNKSHHKLIKYNVDRPNAPYFLTNESPFYVYDLPINNYGLYNMIGNVSELVKEKGIIKGGSYMDKIEDCGIKMNGKYVGAAPNVGFRAVCEIKYVNFGF